MDYSPIKIAQWVGAKENALNHDNKNSQNKNGHIGRWQIFQSPLFALTRERCCY